MSRPRGADVAREPSSQQLIVLSGLVGGWTDVVDLLVEARERLSADEAALLLVDTSGTMLVPVASSGLDNPMHSGFRVPVGSGFAGRVAATRAPVLLDHVTPDTVLNPALHRRGISSLLGAPVPGPGGLLGVVHVGSIARRTFTDDDVATLVGFGARLSAEVLRRRASEEHIAALALQRSLLPSSTPAIPGLDLAARYVPADGELGGDWYDVFRLPGGRLGIVMGDVSGHGLAAAVVMGRLRSALRAYALEHADPAEVLRRLDVKITHFEAGVLATVAYAVAEPPYDRFTVSSAGHLPPYIVSGAGAVAPVDVLVDPPLGVLGDSATMWKRRTVTVHLGVGDALCLYTDGLIERRPTGGEAEADQLASGMAHLVATLRPDTADKICIDVLNALVGEDTIEDDVALLVLRRTASSP